MDELLERLAEVSDLEQAGVVLGWDQEVCMPAAGAEGRGEIRATVGRIAHERFTDEHMGELLDAAQPRDELEADVVRVCRRDYDRARRVPGELVAEMARSSSAARVAWLHARQHSDFPHFAPHLERQLALRRRYSACFPEADHPYDPLLDDFEPGLRTAELTDILERLRDGLVPLVAGAPEIDDSLLRDDAPGAFPEAGQRALGRTVLRAVGVDDEAWRLDDAAHPFQATLATGDVRLTTRYNEQDLDSLYSSLHEFGHGLYERQVDPALARTTLAGGVSGAWHESQSRMWENMVGRSAGFWRWCLPHLQAALPGRFDGSTWQELQRAANAVRKSFIRVSADEVTYGLHIVLRYELELAMVEGDLAVADVPAAWNDRMRDYLGLEVPDDTHGVLQDVHWSEGIFGYFPTYALGNVIAGQLWERVTAELPDLDERFAAGDFAPLAAWLGEHVHRFGRRLMPAELLERVVGGPLDPGPYLAYLEGKLEASAAMHQQR
jgi:carboxypeptidase Taq